MKKRNILVFLGIATAFSALTVSSKKLHVEEMCAAQSHVKSSYKTIHDSIVEETVEYALLDETSTYNLGDGSLATFKVNKGTSTEVPKIRRYSNGTKYYLYLKYSNNKTADSDGAYFEINSAAGKGINKISWDSFKSVDANKYGYRVYVKNIKTGLYEVEREVAPTAYGAPDITFEKQTTSVRVYHWIPKNAAGYDYLGILDISAYIDDTTFKTLTFDSKGGSEVAPCSYYSDEVTVAPTNPTRANEGTTKYTFAGWFTDADCTAGNEYAFGAQLTENKTLYAKWNEEQVSGYTLTFVTNSSSVIEPQVVEVGSKFSKPLDPTKESDSKYDYSFENWYADSALTTLFDFDTVYTEDKTCYAKYSYSLASISGATVIGMKTKIKTYGASWSNDAFEEHTLQSSEVEDKVAMVDSTFNFSSPYYDGYGIKRLGAEKYDVKMKGCMVSWELNDYSKYIKTVRWDIKNTAYYKTINETYLIQLFANASGTGSVIDQDYVASSSTGNRAVQMTNNTDETINAVSFKQVNVSFEYGFENITYILGEASDGQQTKNFSKAFLQQFTCSGEGSVTATQGMWETFANRVAKMSIGAKTILEGDESTDQNVIDALARYDFVIQKYGTAKYADFLNRFGGSYSPSGIKNNLINGDDTNMILPIVIVSIVGISVIAGFFFVKRRKEN